jgi:hypothetical protein
MRVTNSRSKQILVLRFGMLKKSDKHDLYIMASKVVTKFKLTNASLKINGTVFVSRTQDSLINFCLKLLQNL